MNSFRLTLRSSYTKSINFTYGLTKVLIKEAKLIEEFTTVGIEKTELEKKKWLRFIYQG